ncbi:hypothetical protein EYF80_010856 [Liparis tanakae]|uniref:Uncharacterized protein n=1 Tax=Liparis tanakae TaxID=230148 RepID=A0A4Z2ILJ9_9TELE|nr:hypothetical protein EYF80_010856 [Liparis tanakae]
MDHDHVMVGMGFPVALHSRETWLPYSTRFSLGTLRIRAGAEHTHRRTKHSSKSMTAHVSFLTLPDKRKAPQLLAASPTPLVARQQYSPLSVSLTRGMLSICACSLRMYRGS